METPSVAQILKRLLEIKVGINRLDSVGICCNFYIWDDNGGAQGWLRAHFLKWGEVQRGVGIPGTRNGRVYTG